MGHGLQGRKLLVLPFVGMIVVATLIALVVYPVVSASPKDLPLAIVSLDRSVQTPQGTMNIGAKMADTISSAGGDESPIAWTRIDNTQELDERMASNEFYAAIIIPEDFTASSMAAQRGSGVQSPLTVEINQGKNPMIADTVETMLGSMVASNGVAVEIEYYHAVPEGMGAGNIAQQISYMLAMIITIVCSILLFRATKPEKGATRKERAIACVIQIVYAAILAFCIGWFASFFMTSIVGIELSFVETMLFLFLASFGLIMLFIAFFNWHIALGAIVLAVVVVCGLTTALLPYELLPAFWRDWLYPWVPQRFVADGLRQVLYEGAGGWNSAGATLFGIAVAGMAVSLLSLLKPTAQGSHEGGSHDPAHAAIEDSEA